MIRWLQPGLGIKRWIVLIGVSSLLLGVGFVGVLHFTSPDLFDDYWFWIVSSLVGVTGLLAGVFGIIYSVASRTHRGPHSLYQTLRQQSELNYGPNLVAIGGGTGLSTLLRGFKDITSNLTAIVAVTDDGGSSGRIRRDFDLPAPGDLRTCLVALAPEGERLSELVSYRFENGDELEGHSLGNLLLTALSEIDDGFAEAVHDGAEVLAVQGRVLPSMLGSPQLKACVGQEETIVGETNIAKAEGTPRSLEIASESLKPNYEAIDAILAADCLIVGPGSLYTSILTNFLEPRLCEAIRQTDAPLVYVCNLMTEAGETDGYSVGDHLQKFREIPPEPIEFDHVIVNTRQVPPQALEEYREEGASQVVFDYSRVNEFSCQIHTGNFMSVGEHLRHDVDAVINEIQWILQEHTP